MSARGKSISERVFAVHDRLAPDLDARSPTCFERSWLVTLGNLQRGRLNGLRGAIDRRVQLCPQQNREP
jgi:hypothetical protein